MILYLWNLKNKGTVTVEDEHERWKWRAVTRALILLFLAALALVVFSLRGNKL